MLISWPKSEKGYLAEVCHSNDIQRSFPPSQLEPESFTLPTLSQIQEMRVIHEERRVATLREMTELNSTELPMLMRESGRITLMELEMALR